MIGACLWAGPVRVLGATEGFEFTNCLQILKLTPEQVSLKKPAKVQGVITCYVPASSLCFVQDGTAGIYVQPAPWRRDLAFGAKVEVKGVTAAGLFSPIIDLAEIKPIGKEE